MGKLVLPNMDKLAANEFELKVQRINGATTFIPAAQRGKTGKYPQFKESISLVLAIAAAKCLFLERLELLKHLDD